MSTYTYSTHSRVPWMIHIPILAASGERVVRCGGCGAAAACVRGATYTSYIHTPNNASALSCLSVCLAASTPLRCIDRSSASVGLCRYYRVVTVVTVVTDIDATPLHLLFIQPVKRGGEPLWGLGKGWGGGGGHTLYLLPCMPQHADIVFLLSPEDPEENQTEEAEAKAD